MSGFVGFHNENIKVDDGVLDQMVDTLSYRGKAGKSVYKEDTFGIGIISSNKENSEEGINAPLYDGQGYLMVCDGKIYNADAIKDELINKHKCEFSTDRDEEIIVAGYKVYGEKILSMMRGTFSFVIYDKEKKMFFGARDCFGVKPLYYTKMDGSFIFGSGVKAFLAHPSFKRDVNKDALKLFMIFQYTPMNDTMFKDVYKVDAGSYFTYDGTTYKSEKYFDINYDIKSRTFDETVGLIEKTAMESIDLHIKGEKETNVFLSGGVDSSYVAASIKPKKSFTVGFEVDGFDERSFAKELSESLGIENYQTNVNSEDFFNTLPKIQYMSDEPHGNLSAIPLYFLSQFASKKVNTVLGGEGADELFGGYALYSEGKTSRRYKKIVPAGIRKRLGKFASTRQDIKGMGFLKRNALPLEDAYIGQSFVMDNEEANECLADEYKSDIRYQDITKPFFDKVKDLDDLHKKMYLDMHIWIPHDILLKGDRMTMAHDLELRVPLLDKVVWDFARTIESKHCIDEEKTKIAFRRAALDKLPVEWAKRKKVGFLVPFRVWMKEDKYYNMVKKVFETDYAAKFFKKDILLKWLEYTKEGRKGDYHRKAYNAYVFLLWYEQYFIVR